MDNKFLKCGVCGQSAMLLKMTDKDPTCCGKPMQVLAPSTLEQGAEKHVPVHYVVRNVVKVKVGSTSHPMQELHYIEWIFLQTKRGCQYALLKPNDPPEAEFPLLEGDEVEAVYCYCNIHGLWKA